MVSENPPASPTTRHTSASPLPFVPPAVQSLADTGLPILWLQDLVLKIIYFQGYITGFKVAEAAMLPFTGVMDQILESLKRDKLLEVRTSPMALGEGSYIYAITDAGTIRAREALERCQYAGPAPVPLAAYTQACQRQKRRRLAINEKIAHQVFSNLVLSEKASVTWARRSIQALRFFCTAHWRWQDQRGPHDWQPDVEPEHLHPYALLHRRAGD